HVTEIVAPIRGAPGRGSLPSQRAAAPPAMRTRTAPAPSRRRGRRLLVMERFRRGQGASEAGEPEAQNERPVDTLHMKAEQAPRLPSPGPHLPGDPTGRTTNPSWAKCWSRATAVATLSRRIRTKLVQSVKLYDLSERFSNRDQAARSSAGAIDR